MSSKPEFETLDTYTEDELADFMVHMRNSRATPLKVARTPTGRPKAAKKEKTTVVQDPAKFAAMMGITLEEAQTMIAMHAAKKSREEGDDGED